MSSDISQIESALERAIRIAGGQAALAASISRIIERKVTQQAVSWWLTKRGHEVPPEYCRPIEQATDGAVTRAELRPDLFADQQRAA